ncbi:MAG: 30S ribosomal protein S4 [Candidatus Gracilibacteria bacterium]|nr:30S ribosomal protein S4 [Candidatus Gracilibacteria bacterium]
MARYTGPKARLCRREGIDLFGRPKYAKILERRGVGVGMHLGGRPGKKSGYAIQLREKQKLRFMFVLSEKQFKKYFDKANRMKGVTGDNLMQVLETRLDNAIYRAGFGLTRFQSRQMATHGHFEVNGRRVDVPSYNLRVGDVFQVRSKTKNSKLFANVLEENKNYKPSRWLKVNTKELSAEVVAIPTSDDFEQIIDTQKIIEYYSR